MRNELIYDFIQFWRKTLFLEPLLILLFIGCFVISITRHKKEKERLYFIPYFFAGIALFTVYSPPILLALYRGRQFVVMEETTNTVFEFTEFLAFYFFLKKCLAYRIFKNILTVLFILLIVVIAGFFVALTLPGYSVYYIKQHSLFINVIEFSFLCIMCLAYFYEVFTSEPQKQLFKRPSLLIITSAFFYSALMLPFFAIANVVGSKERLTYYLLFSFHFVLLGILLISIARAFLQRLPITA